jgi:chromosome segregation protein
LEEERTRLATRLQEFSASVEAEKMDAQAHRGTLEERQQRLRALQEELSAATQEMDDWLRQQAGNRSRLNLLEQLDAEREGFGAGPLSALKSAEQALGLLADEVRAPEPHVTAVEAALGRGLQLVLTAREESARQILDGLRANKSGRASVAALDLQNGNDALAAPVPAGMIPLLSVIEAGERVRPLLRNLLGRTVIAPDLAAAGAAWRESGGAFDFVTPAGEMLDRHGVFTGGCANGNGADKATASILGRKNQIAELRAGAAALQEKVTEASRRKGALLSEQTQLQAGLHQAQTQLRSQEVAIATRQGEFNALQNSARVLEQKIDTVVYEISSLAAQEEEGGRKRRELGTQAAAMEAREHQAQAGLSEWTAALENLRQQRESANAVLTETKVALATEEQLCASFASQKKPLEQRLGELGNLVEQRRREIQSFLERNGQAEAEAAESRQKIEGARLQRDQVNGRIAGLLDEKRAEEEEIGRGDEALRAQRRVLTELQEQRGALEVELAQKSMAVQNLRDRIREKYQLNLDDIRSECITITLAEEGPPKVHTLTPEEMEANGVSTDWASVAEQVAALQRRIDEIGPVNLVAIDEYEETEQRHQFLTAQNDDLTQARAQLLEVINRINTQTRQMFVETFEKIRDNFRLMFEEVFGGGKADLILVDQGDVLECGIDIVARPPGKQLQSISLMSGGEQTMTAVALLFSIYQVKPSPFCILDELDAPLDESNINRFIRVLHRFLVHSQFIIITHNKRTIAMADVLYGVTMQEHGVSKIVSVKFHKSGDAQVESKARALESPQAAPEAPMEERAAPGEESQDVVMAK